MRSLFARLRGHFQENVARYAVLALSILTPASGLLGTAAAHLGGADSQGGRIALGAASAVATAIAGVTFIRNLGIWQMLDRFGVAPSVNPKSDLPMNISGALSKALAPVADKPATVGSTPVADAPPLPVPDADSQDQLEATDGLPSDDEDEATTEVGVPDLAPVPPPEPPPPAPAPAPGPVVDAQAPAGDL